MKIVLLLVLVKFPSILTLSDTDILSKFHQNDYKLKFERLELFNYSKRIYREVKIITFKHNRTAAATNISFIPKINIDTNKVQVLIQVYKFLSNEYRIFPIHFQVGACKALKMNTIGIIEFTVCGNVPKTCFFKKDTYYYVCNFVPDESRFPPFLPSGDFQIEVILLYENDPIMTVHALIKIYRPLKY